MKKTHRKCSLCAKVLCARGGWGGHNARVHAGKATAESVVNPASTPTPDGLPARLKLNGIEYVRADVLASIKRLISGREV